MKAAKDFFNIFNPAEKVQGRWNIKLGCYLLLFLIAFIVPYYFVSGDWIFWSGLTTLTMSFFGLWQKSIRLLACLFFCLVSFSNLNYVHSLSHGLLPFLTDVFLEPANQLDNKPTNISPLLSSKGALEQRTMDRFATEFVNPEQPDKKTTNFLTEQQQLGKWHAMRSLAKNWLNPPTQEALEQGRLLRIDQLQGIIARNTPRSVELSEVTVYQGEKKFFLPYARIALYETSLQNGFRMQPTTNVLITHLFLFIPQQSLPLKTQFVQKIVGQPITFNLDPAKSNWIDLDNYQKAKNSSPFYLFVKHQLNQTTNQNTNAIAKALLIGDWGNVDQQFRQQLSELGIIHLLAISGLHLLQITLLVILVVRPLIRAVPRWNQNGKGTIYAQWLALIVSFGFVYFLQFPVPATRAWIFFVFWVLTQHYFLYYPNIIRFLFCVVLFLIYEPHLIGSLSFNLSFLAVFGILLGNLVLHCWWPSSTRIKNPFLLYCCLLLSNTFFITLVLFPIQWMFFNTFNPWAFFNNLFHILFASWVILPCSMLMLLIHLGQYFFVLDTLNNLYYPIFNWLLKFWEHMIQINYSWVQTGTWQKIPVNQHFFYAWYATIAIIYTLHMAYNTQKTRYGLDFFYKKRD